MGYRVLAVDDSLLMQKKVASALRESEFELVGTAGDGREAVTRYAELRPDVVLLDIVMPGQTGKEALKEILAIDEEARVIMVSSLGTEDAVTDCIEAGAARFLQKPFAPEDLLEVLRATVGRGR